ncbi:MAG: alpha/beta hydrolase [Smithellaceae bacterium]
MISKRIPVAIMCGLVCMLILQGCTSLLVGLSRSTERHKSGLSKNVVDVGDHQIAYLDGGKGEAVILLHGFGDNKDSWVKFARRLTQTHRVIIPDLPGFGESTKKMSGSYDIATQVARLHELAGKLGLAKFHIAGNSMGGLIAGVYAADHPGRILSLGLIDTAGIPDREQSGLARELARGVNPLLVEKPEDFDRLLNFMFVTPPAIAAPVKKYIAQLAVVNHDFNQKVFDALTPAYQLEARLKDIKARTLVIWGDTDRVFPVSSARVIQEGIEGAKVFIIKDCGHLPMVEKPDESAGIYLDFILSRQAAAAATIYYPERQAA